MSENIDADSATLAGLQIDILQKYRAGKVTLDHLRWFSGLTKNQRDKLSSNVESTSEEEQEKFVFLKDLGTIVVPEHYNHDTFIASFKEQNASAFYYYNEAITDENFANPSRILEPGDKLSVKVFKQSVSETTTSEERLAFLKSQNAVFPGAQGVALVFEQKKYELLKGYWYTSLDEKSHLWEDSGGHHWVPRVFAYSDGSFNFYLGYFEIEWLDNFTILCFCDMPLEA